MTTMPRLIGSDAAAFSRWMRDQGYPLETRQSGDEDSSEPRDGDVIVETRPARDESWSPEGGATRIDWARPGEKKLFLPDVIGMTFSPANSALQAILPASVTPFPAANEPKWTVASVRNGKENGPTVDPGDPVDPGLDITLIMDEPANPQAQPAVLEGALVGAVGGAVLGAALGAGVLEQGSLISSLLFGTAFGALGGALGAIVAGRIRTR